MAIRQPLYSQEEFAQRGDEIYETKVRPQVETVHYGKIVEIDLETGYWEIDTNEISACKGYQLLVQVREGGLVEISKL